MTAPAEEAFRRLTIGDPVLLAALSDLEALGPDLPRLDARTEVLLSIAAMIAIDAPQSLYLAPVDAALRAGASLDDLAAVIAAVAGVVGSARIVAAAPRIALAAGYDVEAALEDAEPARR